MKELKMLGASIAKNVSAMGFLKNGKKMSHRQGLDVVAKLGGMKAWQAVAALKPKNEVKGALIMDQPEDCDGSNYILLPDRISCWIMVDGFAIYIHRTDEGVVIDTFAHKSFNDDPISSTYSFHSDAEFDLCESREAEIDQVAEWVGLHYKVNFDAESGPNRYKWILRYLDAHEDIEEDHANVLGCSLYVGDIVMTLSFMNEGHDGDYNPNDPNDEPLLRFDIIQKDEDGEFADHDCSSGCCQLNQETSTPEQRQRFLELAMCYAQEYLVTGKTSAKSLVGWITWCGADWNGLLNAYAAPASLKAVLDKWSELSLSPAPQTKSSSTFAQELIEISGYGEVIEDSDQPGMFVWIGADISFHTKEEAERDLASAICSRIMGICNFSSEKWDSLSNDQKLQHARDVFST
jgi:hypothetical protein